MKNIRFFTFFTLILLLTACGSPATPTLGPTIPPAKNTPVPLPSETPIPPEPTLVPTLVPSPTLDPLLFKDDFEGGLAEGWKWTRENKKTSSFKNNPGWLEIIAGPGNVGGGKLDNLLLRQIPDGNFELETKIKFKPTGDYQIAGLLIYESAGNFIQFGRAFCDAPKACAKDGFYVDLYINSNYDAGNLATEAKDTDIAFLRLRHEGIKYTAYASYDGETWQLIGEKNSEMKPKFIGLMAGQAFSAPKPAQFDYFIVNQLP